MASLHDFQSPPHSNPDSRKHAINSEEKSVIKVAPRAMASELINGFVAWLKSTAKPQACMEVCLPLFIGRMLKQPSKVFSSPESPRLTIRPTALFTGSLRASLP